MKALVLGGASCVWDEIKAAKSLFSPDIVVACNHIGFTWPYKLDHWCSYHCNLLPLWIEKRKMAGFDPAGKYWTNATRINVPFPIERLDNVIGGSSGMLAAFVALEVGATKVVLAGIPMSPSLSHFHDEQQNKPWVDGKNYHKHWIENKPRLEGKVKSFSGFTMELLGTPTKEWLDDTYL